jgi:hypothetical protein
MKESFWGYLIVILGLFVTTVMIIVQNTTTTDEENTYAIKEIMEAAMVEAVDYGVYRKYGDLRIIKEKFVESFIRRFSETVKGTKTYTIEFYELYEDPPKASVKISTSTGEYQVNTSAADFDIVTILSGVLETKY